MKFKRFFAGLALSFALAAGLYKGADAAMPSPPVKEAFNSAAISPQQQGAREYRIASLKEPDAEAAKDLWRVRVGSWEIGLGGHHTFLEFSPVSSADPSRKDVYQLHGIACDEVRHTWAQLNYKHSEAYTQYFAGDYVLKATGINQDHHRRYFSQQPAVYVDIFYGSKEEVLKMYLDGMQLVKEINRTNDPYILLDHNSNSMQRTLREALGLPEPEVFVPYRIAALGGRVWTPGVEKSLLPKDWDRDKARKEGGHDGLPAAELEARARELSGAEKMFATLRERPKKPKGPV